MPDMENMRPGLRGYRGSSFQRIYRGVLLWLVLLAIDYLLTPVALTGVLGFFQSKHELPTYQQDCARASYSTSSENAPCYYTTIPVSFDLIPERHGYSLEADSRFNGDADSGPAVLSALNWTRSNVPPDGRYRVQVWRDKATKIFIPPQWMQTSDDPESAGISMLLAGLAVGIAPLAIDAAAIYMLYNRFRWRNQR